jgi:hypothetical protein
MDNVQKRNIRSNVPSSHLIHENINYQLGEFKFANISIIEESRLLLVVWKGLRNAIIQYCLLSIVSEIICGHVTFH